MGVKFNETNKNPMRETQASQDAPAQGFHPPPDVTWEAFLFIFALFPFFAMS